MIGSVSHREHVVMRGRLQGMGREADCLVAATKVSLPGTDLFEYANCRIHQEPEDLPDGQYTVSFAGRTVSLRKKNGFWVSM